LRRPLVGPVEGLLGVLLVALLHLGLAALVRRHQATRLLLVLLVHAQPFRSRRSQQIRGRGSPTSRAPMRVPPNEVFKSPRPGGSSLPRPITAAPSPRGWERSAPRAASAWSPSTTATSRPSQATYSGAMRG